MTPAELLDRARNIRVQNAGLRMAEGFGARDVGFVRDIGRLQTLGALSSNIPTGALQGAELAALKTQLAEIDRHIARQKIEAARLAGSLPTTEGVDPTGRRGLRERLRAAGFGLNRSGSLQAGPVEIGKEGIRLNRGFINSATGGAFKVALAGNAIAGTIGAAASVKERIERGETVSQIAASIPGSVLETVFNIAGLGRGVANVGRFFGRDPADVERAFADAFGKLRGEDPAADRAKLAEEAYKKTLAEIDEVMRKKWAAVEHWTPSDFRIIATSPDTIAQFRAQMRKENEERFAAERAILNSKAKSKYVETRDGGGD